MNGRTIQLLLGAIILLVPLALDGCGGPEAHPDGAGETEGGGDDGGPGDGPDGAADADGPSDGSEGVADGAGDGSDVDADGEVRDEGGGEAYELPVAVLAVDPVRLPRDDDHATTVTLDATGSTGGGLSFEWTVPDGTFVEGTGPNDAVARVTFPGTADHELLLRVTNAFGSATAFGTVRANRIPRAEAGPGVEVAVGVAATLDGTASADPDGDGLSFSWRITARPAASSADLVGADRATPTLTPDAAGVYEVELVVADGLNVSLPDTVRVVARPPESDPPVVTLTATPPVVPVGSSARVCASATDASGVDSLVVEVDGSPLTLGAGGCADYVVGAVARHEAVAVARDVWGNDGTARATFYGRAGSDNGPPTVALTAPADGSHLEAPTDVRGTAQDADLVLYRIETSAPGAGAWVPFAEGRTSVTGGVLGRIDPGAFVPGMYDARLCAEDSWGHVACTAPVVWDLAGAAPPPGTVRLVFTDAAVDLLGLPIAVRRVYDSRRRESGDFGFGWAMEVAGAGTFEESNPPGEGWTYSGCTGLPFRPVLAEQQSHVYTVRLGDRAYRFRFAPTGRACGSGFAEVVPAFAALPGTTATLSAPGFEGSPDWIILSGDSEIVDWDFDVYRPTRFVMTTTDGYRYDLEVGRGITRVTDPAGHWLSLSAGRLEHSSGVALDTPRDAAGRVTSLRRPDGATRTYRYDARGDLVGTTDFGGYETRYEYDGAHRLLRIVDPRGGVPGMMEYDADGRLVAIVDAAGRRITFTHDPAHRQEVITDRLGNVTVLYYDERGNVVRRVDPLGHEWTFAYDAAGNRISETDPTGATTRYEYDAGGNRTAVIDALGNRWATAYDPAGRMVSEADPLGNTRRYEYDAAGHLVASVSATGARTTYGYDAGGRFTGMELPGGGRVALAYDAADRLVAITDALGRTASYTYTANSEVSSDSFPAEVGGATVTATHRYAYDPRGALTRLEGPDGSAASVSYDAAGYPEATRDPGGAEQRVEYDSLGRLAALESPGSERVTLVYDTEDRPTEVMLPSGATLRTTLDPLGRPAEAMLPGGATMRYEYDAAGRIARVTGPLGRSTSYTYDAAGRVVAVTLPDGSTQAVTRDAAGRVTEMIDAGGGRSRSTYDAEGRLTGITRPDGATTTMTYDPAGRLASVRDPAGRVLRYAYDSAGRLVGVTDALGGAAAYAYDVADNLVRITTPSGRATVFSYDIMGRLLERSGGPLDGRRTFTYDAAGRVTHEADPAGGSVDYSYDAAGRLTERRGSDGAGETRTWGPGGRLRSVTDRSGTTRYLYDAAGRLVRVVLPDGAFVAYGYDAAGSVVEVSTRSGTTRYEWDAGGRLAAVTDPDGGRTTYTYDAAGRLAGAAFPNGAGMAMTRDAAGRPARIVHRGAGGTILHEESYERDGAGRIVRVVTPAGATEYAYDAEGRIASERRPDGRTLTYAYDGDGNLVAKGAAVLTYDERGRLTGDGTSTLTWDPAGRLASRDLGAVHETFVYDGLGRLVRIDRTGASPSRIEFAYDGGDLLARVTVDGEVRNLLWDASGAVPVLLEETDASGVARVRYTWGAGPISRRGPEGVRYLHVDARGSVRLETDAAGAAAERADYLAWGEADGGTASGGLGFAGEWRVPGTDLYYLRARFYDPRSGRFITPDPAPADLQDPRTLNPYLYSRGDPVNLRDPTGQFSMAEVSAVTAIINILSSIVLTVYPDAETIVLDAIGLGRVLDRVQALIGCQVSIGAEGHATRGIGGVVGDWTSIGGAGVRLGVDGYTWPLNWLLWFSIEPFIQLGGNTAPLRGLSDLRRRGDLRAGAILGVRFAAPGVETPAPDWVEYGILASVSGRYLARRLARLSMPTFAAAYEFLVPRGARVEVLWRASPTGNVTIRGRFKGAEPSRSDVIGSLRIGFYLKIILLRLTPTGSGGLVGDLFDRLLEALAGAFV